MSVVAIDCDLRKVYAVSDTGVVVANRVPSVEPLLPVLGGYDIILFEIASPLDYTDSKAIAYQKRRWTIFNISQAAVLHQHFPAQLLVAPSHAWTRGYPLLVRHKLAGATGMNKDLRECRAMIASLAWAPGVWDTFPSFLGSL